MDIVKKLTFAHLKASFTNLALKHKFFLIIFLVSFTVNLLPHEAYAARTRPVASPSLIFDIGNTDHLDYLDRLSEMKNDEYYRQQLEAQAWRQVDLTKKIKEYLTEQGSPLADYTQTLVTLRNWKKIVALSNAESGMCRHYVESTANCWGVGGANLWDMGSNLGQGVVAMNHFLNNYPLRSKVKYSQLNFEQMNGLYKQPAAQHWVDNNQIIYDQLTTIENSL